MTPERQAELIHMAVKYGYYEAEIYGPAQLVDIGGDRIKFVKPDRPHTAAVQMLGFADSVARAAVLAERERWRLARELLEALDISAVSFNNAKQLASEALAEIRKEPTP